MTLMEPPREEPELPADAAIPAPRIINGLTVRPRERVNLWLWLLVLMPDIMGLFVLVAIGMHRLLRYLDSKWPQPNR
jgi:hypothetical protein